MITVTSDGKSIFRIENALPANVCDHITLFMKNYKGLTKTPDLSVMPWQNGDSFDWKLIPNDYIYGRVEAFREFASFLVSNCYNETVYPHFTDLVLWRAGRSMDRHKDDGYGKEDSNLNQRIYTSVTYLNVDYTGGETFIRSGDSDYISVPKKGTMVICKSNEENAHGVNEITSGIRVTLPMWFTRNYSEREMYSVR